MMTSDIADACNFSRVTHPNHFVRTDYQASSSRQPFYSIHTVLEFQFPFPGFVEIKLPM